MAVRLRSLFFFLMFPTRDYTLPQNLEILYEDRTLFVSFVGLKQKHLIQYQASHIFKVLYYSFQQSPNDFSILEDKKFWCNWSKSSDYFQDHLDPFRLILFPLA